MPISKFIDVYFMLYVKLHMPHSIASWSDCFCRCDFLRLILGFYFSIVITSDIHLIGNVSCFYFLPFYLFILLLFTLFVCLFVRMSFRYFINYIIDYMLWVICARMRIALPYLFWEIAKVVYDLVCNSVASGKSARDKYWV